MVELTAPMTMGLLAIFSMVGLVWVAALVVTDKALEIKRKEIAVLVILACIASLSYLGYAMYL